MLKIPQQNNSIKFCRSIVNDIGETLCPIVMVTRKPDGSGLYQHYKGVFNALEGSVSVKTLLLGEDATIENIRKFAWENGVASVVFCEPFYHIINPQELKLLKEETSLKVGLIFAWDSTELDPRDVDCINESVDVLFSVCAEFAELWRPQISSKVQINYLREPLSHGYYESIAPVRQLTNKTIGNRIRILSVASYHPRKNHDLAIKAVENLLNQGVDCQLRIHSNLNQGMYENIKKLGERHLGERFQATTGDISTTEMLEIYRESDIYLSCSQGEGCNIGLRAALSSGMPIVFTDIPGHRDLLDYGIATYPIKASEKIPAIYPERSNKAFGYQMKANVDSISSAILKACEDLRKNIFDPLQISTQIRKQDERRSKLDVWRNFATSGILTTHQKLGVRRDKLSNDFEDVLIVPSLDAGFFSIVNTYLSHKLFWEYPSLYNKVLPYWSPEMVSLATGKAFECFTSYCYSQTENGNAFNELYGDRTSKENSILDFSKCTFAGRSANAWVDPNLTYIHSEKLYKSAIFGRWREEMSDVFWRNMQFQPHILSEAADLLENIRQHELTLAMHVRHPSHALEQRDNSIAMIEDYVRVAHDWLTAFGSEKSCAIILATDQEEVVFEFERQFPGRVIYRKNIQRVSISNSQAERSLPESERLKEGRQLQHLLASDRNKWHLDNAFDIIADALLLSMADTLVHVNSNISTIVSIINPNISMLHIKSGDDLCSLANRTNLINDFPLY